MYGLRPFGIAMTVFLVTLLPMGVLLWTGMNALNTIP
jgi:hypothetical protein